jgi:heterodisulfide reductase subunit A2
VRIGIYFCNCGTNISDKINADLVREKVSDIHGGLSFQTVDFMCSEEGKECIEREIREKKIERVVIAACSPREHELTFMRILSKAGINPYLMQMVNIREQVAWVTEDKTAATVKAARLVGAAIKRVSLHDPLEKREIDICPDVLVIGAGPAGLKAAIGIAGAGRKVTIVEKAPVIGGMPVQYEEVFPNMECGPCMLEPLLAEVMHGEHSGNIEVLTLSELDDVIGSYGNFRVKIRQKPRYVGIDKCIGCAECIAACPVSAENEFDSGMSEKKAIFFPFAGALPNVPSIDNRICLRAKGQDCRLCQDACPVEGAIVLDDCEKVFERTAGAVIVAIGSGTYDCRNLPNLGYGSVRDVLTGPEFERMLASNGPTGGEIRTSNGRAPESVAIIHCVGSLDTNHKEYCSGICCQYALKFSHLISRKLPGTKVHHFFRELSVPGKEEFTLYSKARENPLAAFIRYRDISELSVGEEDDRKIIRYRDVEGQKGGIPADIIILCPAVTPSAGTAKVGSLLEMSTDRLGFFEEMHSRTDAVQSKIRGVFIAGTCQSPMDIQKAMGQGMAAAGGVLSGLVAGRKLEINPVNAVMSTEACSGCRVCVAVCPYRAITFNSEEKVAGVNDVLCQGCGTCVAACPAGAIRANHFTTEEIFSEIEGLLS